MKRLLILADDFTGALDTGVQFVKAGLRVKVLIWTAFDETLIDDACPVYSIDCESRHLSPAAAGERITRICRQAQTLGFEFFYKKTDSTLRGNVGAEIAACRAAVTAEQPFIFIPSYPRADRILRGGLMYVNGVRLDQSDFASDPLNPIKDASALSLFDAHQDLQLFSFTADQFTGGSHPEQWQPTNLYLVDADSDAQLGQIADHLADRKWLNLTGGCAGFAEHLAETLARQSGWTREKSGKPPVARSGLLVICGSTNPRSLRQISQYIKDYPDTLRHRLTGEQKQPAYWLSAEGQALIQTWQHVLDDQQAVILQTMTSDTAFDATVDAETVAASLAQIVRRMAESPSVLTLAVFGGDTLFSIARELSFQYLLPMSEISPGVVQSQIRTKSGTMMLYSKAGGLGHDHVLHDVAAIHQVSGRMRSAKSKGTQACT